MASLFNYKMLALARESRGKTQQQLVAMVPNLNQGNYSKMEKGLLNISEDALRNIAKALDYPVKFFYKESVKTPTSNFYYRKRLSISQKKLSILEAKLDILRLSIDELLDSIEIPEFDIPMYEISDHTTPSEVAKRLRDFLKLPKGPVKNLIRILEAHGVVVFFLNTDIEKFDGITLVTDGGQPIIFVNNSMPNDRKRFTIAHELIHLVSHIPYTPLSIDRDEENEANVGAAEFLMPYLDCKNDLLNIRYSHLSNLKNYWGVSKAMILIRAKQLNLITPQKCTNFYIELSRNGERKKEKGIVEIDQPSIIDLVIKTYKNELGYSVDDMLNVLAINVSDYYSYFENSNNTFEIKTKKIIELNSLKRAL